MKRETSFGKQLKRKNREVKGEQQVDYPLRFLEDNRNIILHNVRIADANGYFQIDTLILTEKYLLILEVKNWFKRSYLSKMWQYTNDKEKNKWLCVMCNYTSMSAHFSALNDYILLIGDSITNRKARDFLQLESPYVAKRILLGANPDVFGNKSKRVYTLKMMN